MPQKDADLEQGGFLSVLICEICGQKLHEPRSGFAGKFHWLAAPKEFHRAGVEGLVFKNQFRALLRRQAVLDERHIYILVAAVKFVANDGMADVREVDADLMLATGMR
jgi:hypothetical protein